jgi:hypothetical protein
MESQLDGTWRKSSYSAKGGGNSVEVGQAARVVEVRDTADRAGMMLTVSADAWGLFTDSLRENHAPYSPSSNADIPTHSAGRTGNRRSPHSASGRRVSK